MPTTAHRTRRMNMIKLLADGLSHGEIAARLGLTTTAVRGQLRRAIAEWGLPSTPALVTHAYGMGWLSVPADTTPATPLPGRLRPVLALVALGFSDAQIGRRLNTSRHTISGRIKQLARHYNTNGRAHTIAAGFRNGHLPAALLHPLHPLHPLPAPAHARRTRRP